LVLKCLGADLEADLEAEEMTEVIVTEVATEEDPPDPGQTQEVEAMAIAVEIATTEDKAALTLEAEDAEEIAAAPAAHHLPATIIIAEMTEEEAPLVTTKGAALLSNISKLLGETLCKKEVKSDLE
jgi:hypothetical protein